MYIMIQPNHVHWQVPHQQLTPTAHGVVTMVMVDKGSAKSSDRYGCFKLLVQSIIIII